MPVIALVGAAGAIAGGMAVGASTLVGGLMIAGGVASGLGAVTGNKKLSMLGAVIGLGAGAYGAATGAFSSASSAIPTDGFAGGAMAAADADMLSGLAGTGYEQIAEGVASSPVADLGSTAIIDSNLGAPGALPSALDGGAAGPRLSRSALDGTTATGGTGPASVAAAAKDGLIEGNLPAIAPPQSAPVASRFGTKVNEVMDFIRKNPEAAKVGAGLVSGGVNAYSQQASDTRREKLAQEARDRYNNSIKQQYGAR